MFSNAIPKRDVFDGLSVSVWRQTARGTASFLAVLTLASCAVSPIGDGSGPAVGSAAREQAVASRVGERWDAVIKGDYARAYEYLSPASRASMPIALSTSAMKPRLRSCNADTFTAMRTAGKPASRQRR